MMLLLQHQTIPNPGGATCISAQTVGADNYGTRLTMAVCLQLKEKRDKEKINDFLSQSIHAKLRWHRKENIFTGACFMHELALLACWLAGWLVW
jgi:hypothetical protein